METQHTDLDTETGTDTDTDGGDFVLPPSVVFMCMCVSRHLPKDFRINQSTNQSMAYTQRANHTTTMQQARPHERTPTSNNNMVVNCVKKRMPFQDKQTTKLLSLFFVDFSSLLLLLGKGLTRFLLRNTPNFGLQLKYWRNTIFPETKKYTCSVNQLRQNSCLCAHTLSPLTLPSIFPFASSSSTPIHSPGATYECIETLKRGWKNIVFYWLGYFRWSESSQLRTCNPCTAFPPKRKHICKLGITTKTHAAFKQALEYRAQY